MAAPPSYKSVYIHLYQSKKDEQAHVFCSVQNTGLWIIVPCLKISMNQIFDILFKNLNPSHVKIACHS